MSVIARDLAYVYPTGETLGPFEFSAERGQLLVIAGPSGCGKSTLVRMLAGIAGRHGAGTIRGELRIEGIDPAMARPADRLRTVGYVPQELAHALVAETVAEELAFPLESLCVPPREIAEKVQGTDLQRKTATLSGGQRQRLAVRAAQIAGAKWLILDEPLAHLDPLAALEAIDEWKALCAAGFGVIVAEHRLEALFERADRLMWMDRGRILGNAAPGGADLAEFRRLGLSIPGMLDAEDRLGRPLGVVSISPSAASQESPPGKVLLSAGPLTVDFGSHRALDGVELELRAGERVALLGGNGSGKSTCLRCLDGELFGGLVRAEGTVIAVPQDPDLALFCATVRQELEYGAQGAIEPLLSSFGLAELGDRPPQGLSRGQRLRAAVAAAVACKPAILLLDEPTAGQDRAQVEGMLTALVNTLDQSALLFATHEVEVALRFATRVIVLDAGQKIADGLPERVLFGLPEGIPLVIPALQRWCHERGLPPMTPAEIAGAVR